VPVPKKNPRDSSEPKILYHMGPGGTFEEDNYYRRNVAEYPDFGGANQDSGDKRSTISGQIHLGGPRHRPSSSLSQVTSTKNVIKANAPFRSTILKQIIASLNKQSVRQPDSPPDGGDKVSTVSSTVGRLAVNELQKYLKIVNKMAEISIDIRRLNYLRLCLLSDDEENKYLPVDFFLKTAAKILNLPHFEKSELYALMKEVLLSEAANTLNNKGNGGQQTDSVSVVAARSGAAPEEGISLAKFSLLIDLYHYYPIMRKTDRNTSSDLYMILSSNKVKGPQPKRLHSMLEKESSMKIQENPNSAQDNNRLNSSSTMQTDNSTTPLQPQVFKAGSV
jgi:hypothetical protein